MSYDNPINGDGGYNAIEVDKGVLLFSRSEDGFKLFHDYMGLFMDNLYNPLCDNTHFNLHYIESNDPTLKEKCDIALKYPEKHLPLQIPIKDECFTEKDVLKDSLDVKVNAWEPIPEQIQRITDYTVGVHIPVKGDTFNISTLQEIAEGISYNRVLLSGTMSDFKYEEDFVELAKKMATCSNGKEAENIAKSMKTLASELLERDYPDIRQMPELSVVERLSARFGEYDHLRKNGPECYNAIEVDNGVLLFSRTEEGKELFEKNLEKYLDNFYNPKCDNTYLNIHYLECPNGMLSGMSDLAIKFLKVQQADFPPNESFLMDKSILKYSLQDARFSWKPEPYAIGEIMNEVWDGKHLPMNFAGDTYNISVLKEIASMELYYFTSLSGLANHNILDIDEMRGFRYKDDFKDLAEKAINFSGHIRQYDVLEAMRDKANEILKRDFPDIRKEMKTSPKEKPSLILNPTPKKKGLGL